MPRPSPSPSSQPTVLDRLGGPWGIAVTAVPQVAFAMLIVVTPLPTTAAASCAVALLLGVAARTLGRVRWSVAAGGVLGVAVAGAVAVWTGSASDHALVGIVAALVAFVANAGSIVVRRPLTKLAWNALHGGGHDWRSDRPTLRAHDLATGAAALVSAARFVVLQWLHALDDAGALAVARVGLGLPLTAVAAVVVVRAFRRSTRRLLDPPATRADGTDRVPSGRSA